MDIHLNTTLNFSLIGEAISESDIPNERNSMCGSSNGALGSESQPSVSQPAATPQHPTTTTDGDEQQSSDGEHEPVD